MDPASVETPSVGRIVHFKASPEADCQAAIVVRVWTPLTVNLVVFRDGSNDDRHDHRALGATGLTVWETSVHPEGSGKTWHWPERVS